jgi:hypothetical protein
MLYSVEVVPTARVKVRSITFPALSCRRKLKLVVPVLVGVPVISPDEFIDSPVGKLEFGNKENVYGPVPLMALICVEYMLFAIALGSESGWRPRGVTTRVNVRVAVVFAASVTFKVKV